MARALFARSGCSPVNKTPTVLHLTGCGPLQGDSGSPAPSAVCKDLGTRLVYQWSPRQFKGFGLFSSHSSPTVSLTSARNPLWASPEPSMSLWVFYSLVAERRT